MTTEIKVADNWVVQPSAPQPNSSYQLNTFGLANYYVNDAPPPDTFIAHVSGIADMHNAAFLKSTYQPQWWWLAIWRPVLG